MHRQAGMALFIVMFVLVAAMLVGASTVAIGMDDERSARAERDTVMAFMSAEAALDEAEHSIELGAQASNDVILASTSGYFQFGQGSMPAQAAHYLIETLPDDVTGTDAGQRPKDLYRITAIGYGMRASTQAVLQSVYRKSK